MDPISLLKSYARKIRATPAENIKLTHGQALEIAVSLVSRSNSWNEFAANPHEPVHPATVSDYLACIVRTQRRITALNVAPFLSRGVRSYAAVQFYAVITDSPPFTQLWDLLDAEGVITSWFVDVGTSRKAQLSDGETLLSFRLGSWYFAHRDGDRWPWDTTQKLALTMGFSEDEASTIRQLQREAPNHSWDLELWFEVGVLDPDQRLFLEDLKNSPGWQATFDDLYDTDGGRGSYSQDFTS